MVYTPAVAVNFIVKEPSILSVGVFSNFTVTVMVSVAPAAIVLAVVQSVAQEK